jgi:peptide/nickel transport system permease protein
LSSALGRYLVARVGRAALTALLVATLAFLLLRIVPGDPVDAIVGDQASPEDRALVRAQLHLDEPLILQYGRFLATVADGSLGQSFRMPARSVWSLIAEVVPETALLSLCALAIAWTLAIPSGVIAASRRGTRVDRVLSFLSLLGLALPTIWLGPLLVLVFAVKLRVLPLPGDDPGGLAPLVLPALTMGAALSAVLTRQTRAAMIEVLAQPYITAARARGVSAKWVLFKHGLRNALLPVITVGAAQLGALLSGAVIAEKIFEREGLGTLFLDAFFARDLPVVQGVVLVVGLTYVAINLALDLVYGWVDPRVRLT